MVSVTASPSVTPADDCRQPTVTVPVSLSVVCAAMAPASPLRLTAPPPPLTPVNASPSVSPGSSTVSAVVEIVTSALVCPVATVTLPVGAL